MSIQELDIPLSTDDGHRYNLIARLPANPQASLLWLPALGVAARHYLPFAEALAAQGVAVFLQEMRGNGSSNLRPSRQVDWGYPHILELDIARSHAAVTEHCAAEQRIIGGHSIGAQFAACYLGLHPDAFERLWLVASGSPYWRTFPAPKRYVFPFAFQFVPWIADRRGVFHGRRFGFAGDEARSLMRDWANVGLSNRYAAAGMESDLEHALSRVDASIDALLLKDDWFAPRRSLQALLEKMPKAVATTTVMDSAALGAKADHFAWMKRPQAVAAALIGSAASSDA
jgi:predicted alpha/beta hydrolase